MKLIQLLQEASSLSLFDLKKAMQKDPSASIIFKKELNLDSIPDKDAFLATMKYFVFNNENVRNFVASRDNIKDVDTRTFKSYRMIRGKELNQDNLNWLKSFIADIFKEHNLVSKGSLSTDLKKELDEWFNSNRGYHNLSSRATRELMAVPSLRPDKRVLLYRGVLFKEGSLTEYESYDGSLTVGNGLKFLKSIRKGGREIDLTWDKPSSWTKSKEIATRFAMNGPAESHYGAMMNWFDKSMSNKAIDGALGYVISTYAKPEDILIDTELLRANIHMNHGDEAEVVLAPGEYLARVVKKYTVSGEVNPEVEDKVETDTPVHKALASLKEMASSLSLPEQVAYVEMGGADFSRAIYSSEAIPVMQNKSVFKKLLLNSTTTAAVHSFDKLTELYNKELKDLSDEDLRTDKHISDDETRRKVVKLKGFMSTFQKVVFHSKFRNDSNYKGKGKKHELTGEEYRATIKPFDLEAIEKDLLTHGRIFSAGDKSFWALAHSLSVDLTSPKFHMLGSVRQLPIIDTVIDAFYKMVDVDRPSEKAEAIKGMLNLIRKAHRNYIMLKEIKEIHETLQDLLK